MSPLLPGEPGFVFNPLSPEYDRDPYPVLALLREHAPVYLVPGVDALFLSRHADVTAVLADEANFSADRTLW
jgi:cytochrome P450